MYLNLDTLSKFEQQGQQRALCVISIHFRCCLCPSHSRVKGKSQAATMASHHDDSSQSDMERNEPLSSRSSYHSAIEIDTDDVTQGHTTKITTNGYNQHHGSTSNHTNTNDSKEPNGNRQFNTPTSSKGKGFRHPISSSPSIKRLGNQQQRAVGSFMESPSPENWDELVKSMKKICLRDRDNENGGAASDKVPKLPLENNIRRLSFEPAQIHSIKEKMSKDHETTPKNLLQESAEDFAIEHGIFLKAVLQLLHEKDRPMQQSEQLPETRFDDIQNVIKIGSLKKASKRVKGVWNVKFVEIRRGKKVLAYIY